MQVINRLTAPGQIKTVVLRKDEAVVTTINKERIVFKRIETNTITENKTG